MSHPIIKTVALKKDYELGAETVRALRGVDLVVQKKWDLPVPASLRS
jgi:hypothetical protein